MSGVVKPPLDLDEDWASDGLGEQFARISRNELPLRVEVEHLQISPKDRSP